MSVHQKYWLLLLPMLFLSRISFGQASIQGKVVDSSSGKPIPGVNVYLSGTTFGRSTDKNGNYKITLSAQGRYNLVFSFLGYRKQVHSVELQPSSAITINAEMREKVVKLNELRVTASNEKWKKRYAFFFDQFIGKSHYAKSVTVENPWVLNFSEHKGNLIAKAKAPLIVINNALGYKLHVELVQFKWPLKRDWGGIYKMLAHYEPLSTDDDALRLQWMKNRLKNYLGSSTHFLKTLYHGDIKKSNFHILIFI